MTSPNVTWHKGHVSRADRWQSLGSRGATIWFTGLSGSGKSTLASAVEQRLISSGRPAYRLDGDNLRTGLNADLDFTREAREENIRRVAEVAYLFADAGTVALVALISPYLAARDKARELHEQRGIPFVEVYVATSLAVCVKRDPKGLYAQATEGEIPAFTGLDDPYEPPVAPELVVLGDRVLEKTADSVIEALAECEAKPELATRARRRKRAD
ncbi:MAG TPA: adenylyl-sulfate kinase [Acidimicrobiales bacterium]|nr:adenylyl-sulfate kinase [Acidimicrobiales bacterium]